MARRKVREYDAKRLLKTHLLKLANLHLDILVAQVKADTDYVELLKENPWLAQCKTVVKPDMLFGQRGKHDLVGLNLSFNEAQDFIRERMNRQITINGVTGEAKRLRCQSDREGSTFHRPERAAAPDPAF